MKKLYRRKLWGGFSNGRLDITTVDSGWGGYGTGDFTDMGALFKCKCDATAKYEDVRQVEIRELPHPQLVRRDE